MFTRNHLAEMLRQQIQQGELRAGQFQRLAIKLASWRPGFRLRESTSSVGELLSVFCCCSLQWERRRIARIRATSSRSLNGFGK
jgi:hypothetical protein